MKKGTDTDKQTDRHRHRHTNRDRDRNEREREILSKKNTHPTSHRRRIRQRQGRAAAVGADEHGLVPQRRGDQLQDLVWLGRGLVRTVAQVQLVAVSVCCGEPDW